jgi:hypothetical protein
MLQKILRVAEKLGLDKEELLQMNLLEAMLKIDNAKKMWIKYKEEVM